MFHLDQITGIVLAGGKSSRMGQDKGLCLFRDKSLVTYAIDVLKPLCGRLLISSNNLDAYEGFGYEVFRDEIHGIGPMGGLMTCLRQSKTEHNLVLSCDTPFVNTKLFEYLLGQLDVVQKAIVPVHGNGFLEPLAAYYGRNSLTDIEASIANKEYKLMRFLKNIGAKRLAVENQNFYTKTMFDNLNSPDDLLKNSLP